MAQTVIRGVPAAVFALAAEVGWWLQPAPSPAPAPTVRKAWLALVRPLRAGEAVRR